MSWALHSRVKNCLRVQPNGYIPNLSHYWARHHSCIWLGVPIFVSEEAWIYISLLSSKDKCSVAARQGSKQRIFCNSQWFIRYGMVAVLTLTLLDKTVSEAYAIAQRFVTNGWQSKFNDEFFDRLDSTARDFSARAWNRVSIDLLRLGQLIAESSGNSHWVREFSASIQRLQYRQVQNGLPNKMKWEVARWTAQYKNAQHSFLRTGSSKFR